MTKHYIYVIGREEGPVKVGVSSHPSGRLAQLQTGCPFKIGLLYQQQYRDRSHALGCEWAFHAFHASERLAGEWFDMKAILAIESLETDLELEAHFARAS